MNLPSAPLFGAWQLVWSSDAKPCDVRNRKQDVSDSPDDLPGGRDPYDVIRDLRSKGSKQPNLVRRERSPTSDPSNYRESCRDEMATNYPYVDDGIIQGTASLGRSTHSQLTRGSPAPILKEKNMFIWNEMYRRWHECMVTLKSPVLYITEYEDLRVEVNEAQLKHLKASWYHGNLTRREARCILSDYDAGNGSFLVRASESYQGKFAISFVHESRTKHVVVESKRDPVAGIMYNITPNGPYFTTLHDVIEEAKRSPIIQNHMFDIVLTTSPPKINMKWMHQQQKTVSQAHKLLSRDHRDGCFLVYRTNSEDVPYKVSYRSGSDIYHEDIVATQRPNVGYQLHGMVAPVLYKVVHYFMENPIRSTTVLRFPVDELQSDYSNNAIAIHDYDGSEENGLSFTLGSLITNITPKTKDWYTGDFHGIRKKWCPAKTIRLLSKEEWSYVMDMRSMQEDETQKVINNSYTLSMGHCSIDVDRGERGEPLHINLTRRDPVVKETATYRLAAESEEGLKEMLEVIQDVINVCTAKEGQDHNTRGCVLS